MAIELAFSDAGAGPPLVILHGLFGSGRNWASVARALARDRRVLRVDMRNHGRSPWDPVHDYPALAADVARLIGAHCGGRADLLGHSMGGKAAMVLALAQPALVRGLVVVDIPPGPSGDGPRDALRAMRGVDLARLSRRAEVETALAREVADPAVRSFLALNAESGPAGLSWSVNLDAVERHIDAITGFPPQSPESRFSGPTLFVLGGRSTFVGPQHRAEIARLFPRAQVTVVPAAGHWVHAEAPGAFVDVVREFLTACPRA